LIVVPRDHQRQNPEAGTVFFFGDDNFHQFDVNLNSAMRKEVEASKWFIGEEI